MQAQKELRELMQYVIGFVIALFIALTGVGAGTITVPVLVLFSGCLRRWQSASA